MYFKICINIQSRNKLVMLPQQTTKTDLLVHREYQSCLAGSCFKSQHRMAEFAQFPEYIQINIPGMVVRL
jgi:hypothetical protein